MHYLIDGHNLIARMTSIELGEMNSEAELVLLLRRWAASGRKRNVSVVFDRGLPGGENRLLSTGSIRVLFAPNDRTADDLLIARIRKVDNPAEYTIVTDDHSVQAAGKKKKLNVIMKQLKLRRIEEKMFLLQKLELLVMVL